MSEVTPQSCTGALGTWQLQEYPDMLGRRTMECPWKQTKGCRGGCGSALKPRVLWEGDRREAKGRTGLGQAHRPGSQGGPAETWTRVERGTHLAYRKSACWKLSTYSCARRRSIPTPSSTGVERRYPPAKATVVTGNIAF